MSYHLKKLSLRGNKILVRVDFNVPLGEKGEILDDTRIRESLPTLQYILDQGASLILMSHLGNPGGKCNPSLSLKPCQKKLEELLKRKIYFSSDCIGKEKDQKVQSLKPGEILLLENLRFHPEEENPRQDSSFARQLSQFTDFFVNDAFATAHRSHSSTTEVVKYFPGKAALGFLMEKEVYFLGKYFQNPFHPFYAIIGGAKISSKLKVLVSLVEKVNGFFIGGAMSFTFLEALGFRMGDSFLERDLLPEAKMFQEVCKKKRISLHLPKDLVIADEFSQNANKKVISVDQGVPNGWRGMDIGPATRREWETTLEKAKMIFWNGPLGVFEWSSFAEGTYELAKFLSHLSSIRIVGGGDSTSAIHQLKLANKFSHISTGGGASLEFIEKGELPAIQAILASASGYREKPASKN